jgi:PKD repeat protein
MLACITGLLITIQFSCQRLPKPRFTYEPMEDPEAGEVIQFFNESKRGESYFWEFGDGGVSTLTDPQHSFEQAGIYSVTLTASADQGEAYNTERITIFEPTLLGLIVSDSNGSILEGAAVRVYVDEEDWNKGEEPDYSGTTDHQGWLIFRNLESRIYFIDASMEGNGGQWHFRGYTSPLETNEENWFNVPCVWQSDAPHP